MEVSLMRVKNLDLFIILFIVILNVGWTQVPGNLPFVGIILALPLILFFPGYTLTQALFRRREPEQVSSVLPGQSALKPGHPIGGTDQLVLSLGLSMAIDVLVGFVLNILPTGLNSFSWIFSLSLLVIIFAVLAVVFRRKDRVKTTTTLRMRFTLQDALLLGLALLIAGSAIWLAIIRLIQPQPSFTQLWMLQANQNSKTCAVSIGIQSFETSAETYRMVVTVNNAPAKTWAAIALVPQQKWVQSLPVTSASANSLYVEAQLYRVSQPTIVYRDVHLTLYISSANANGVVQQQCVLGS